MDSATYADISTQDRRALRKGLSPLAADIRLGAIYRIGYKKRLSDRTLSSLIVSRLGWKESDAVALVSHWVRSIKYRECDRPK